VGVVIHRAKPFEKPRKGGIAWTSWREAD
jgi:hypothetical protein